MACRWQAEQAEPAAAAVVVTRTYNILGGYFHTDSSVRPTIIIIFFL